MKGKKDRKSKVYPNINSTIRYFTYFIEANKLDLRSVFWNSALISCFTCGAVNSRASGPLPPPHLTSISISDAPNTLINSKKFSHLRTCWRISWGSWKHSIVRGQRETLPKKNNIIVVSFCRNSSWNFCQDQVPVCKHRAYILSCNRSLFKSGLNKNRDSIESHAFFDKNLLERLLARVWRSYWTISLIRSQRRQECLLRMSLWLPGLRPWNWWCILK